MANFTPFLLFILLIIPHTLSQTSPTPSPSPQPPADISPPQPSNPSDLSPSSSPSPSPSPISSPPGPPSDLAPETSPSPSPSPAYGYGPRKGMHPSPAEAADVEVTESNDSGLKGGQKAGIAIGVIAGVCVVGLGALVYKKRKQNMERAEFGYAARREIL